MNIAFAIEHFDSDQGGAEQYAWHFAQWLVRQGHSLDVYTARAAGETNFVRNLIQLNSGKKPSRQLAFAEALKTALAGKNYDIVHGFNHAWPCDVLRLGGGVHLAFEKYNAMSVPNPFTRQLRFISQKLSPRDRGLRLNEQHQFNDPKRQFIAVSNKVA